MPFITKEEAALGYDQFVKKGLPAEGREFEKALVRILFREIGGAKRLDDYYLDNLEYEAYKRLRTQSR